MTDADAAARDDGVLALSGRVTFQTVPDLLARAESWLERDQPPRLTVDLAQVEHVDTAGVALMLEWLSRARARRRELTFINLPEQVRRFIDVSGLNKAFGLA